MKKSLKVAIQMDAIENINFERDTSFILALEAQNRGHSLYYYRPHNMSLKNGDVVANVQELKLKRDKDNYFALGKPFEADMSTMDVVLMRQDPPFDMNYLTYTYMLDKIHPKTLVVNNPTEVRNCPEKLFVCDFKKFTPPTIISSDHEAIAKFQSEHKEIILKPLYAFGGQDIFKVENNLDSLLDEMLGRYNVPVVAQKFLKEITEGDKRIMLINGKPVGALNRIPQGGSIRSNMAQGGKAVATTLTKREEEICEELGPHLKKKGIFLTGLDVIGGYLTEINITSPTGMQVINGLNNTQLEVMFWDEVEKERI
jgi:glutathione synthase